jgi:hypothetical protein
MVQRTTAGYRQELAVSLPARNLSIIYVSHRRYVPRAM